ncbi:15830_t:CDS:1, partial [Acaulospora colombiana]
HVAAKCLRLRSCLPSPMSLAEKKTTGATNGLTLDEILSKDVELKVDGELNEDDAIEEDEAAHVPKEGYCDKPSVSFHPR